MMDSLNFWLAFGVVVFFGLSMAFQAEGHYFLSGVTLGAAGMLAGYLAR